MELLNPPLPSHHLDPTRPEFRVGVDATQLPDIVEEAGAERSSGFPKVYVAVGKSVEKSAALLQWSFNFFSAHHFCLLHVHRPSPLIPTLLGKLPANRANPEVVLAHRNQERQLKVLLLQRYLAICRRAKVEASFVSTECEQVHKGILDLVDKVGVRKLVMGAVPDNCLKVRKSSSKVGYVTKNAPRECHVWLINKGNLFWMREDSSVGSNIFQTDEHVNGGRIAVLGRCRSQRLIANESHINPRCTLSSSGEGITSARVDNWVRTDCSEVSVASTSNSGCLPHSQQLHFSFSPTSSCSGSGSALSSDSDSRHDLERLYCQLEEATVEAVVSRDAASQELVKCKRLELEALESFGKVKIFESALAQEMERRRQAEYELRNTRQEQDSLLEERGKFNRELQRTMRSIALLDSHAHEANRRRDEATAELKLIQTSLASLRQEKQRIRQQKMEALHWLERWRSRKQPGAVRCNGFLGYAGELPELAEFPLSDLQTATCDFSESFRLGGGAYGCVYKGEMLGRTVAIKKLHSHNMQGQSEFQKEVQVLGKLQHPHLVTLLGACTEAWCLIYEYLPNGSLQDRLSSKSINSSLTWKIRTRMIAEIASALSFLHSSKPEKIVHGDLKPQNILLDSELTCKICEFGISEDNNNLYAPNFSRITEPKGAFPYVDPEFPRVGVLTPKSDVYSFGVIILQLLTGRPPVGLASEVRRMTSCRKLSSILDPSAGEWPTYVTKRLADLALQFCESNSKNRPELSPALVRELEQLHVSEERPVPPFFLCPILQEIMHDPQIAADGFTYESEAIREWLGNGHETSPMTNLKLCHLYLTPNHAIRLAIQEWLCRS